MSVPNARRHTFYFLEKARGNCPVYLSTDIDMRAVQSHRNQQDDKAGYVSYLIHAIARVLIEHPEANATVSGKWVPKVVPNPKIDAKFTLDKTIDGTRAVVSALVENVDHLALTEIQQMVNYYRDTPYGDIDEFAGLRFLQGLPMPLGRWLYNALFANAQRRHKLQGSFTVTSLGQSKVSLFLPMTSSTLAFGVGSISPKPIWENGGWQVSPQMPLSMVFDHRVMDGAMAAEILASVKRHLEHFSE